MIGCVDHLQNDLWDVEQDVKPCYTIAYHFSRTSVVCSSSQTPLGQVVLHPATERSLPSVAAQLGKSVSSRM